MKSCMKIALVAGCAMAAVASAKPPLQVLEGPGTRLQPVSIGTVKKVNGVITATSPMMPYGSFSDRAIPSHCLFDCYGRDWTAAATGIPDGPFGGCIAVGSRYYFGAAADNFHWQDDLLIKHYGVGNGLGDGTRWATNFDLTWYNGGPTLDMTVLVFVGDGDLASCTPLANGSGFIVTYAAVPTGGYYYSNIDLPVDFCPMNAADTSYEVIFADSFDPDTNTYVPATGPVQPMLWTTPSDWVALGIDGVEKLPGSFGTQGDIAFDDDNLRDGVFDPLLECYSYDYTGAGLCMSFIGKCVAFGGCSTDFDGDGFQSGDDFDLFVAAFEAGDLSSGYDGDGFPTGDDFDAWVAAFEQGC